MRWKGGNLKRQPEKKKKEKDMRSRWPYLSGELAGSRLFNM
jgi:hypothetical protein